VRGIRHEWFFKTRPSPHKHLRPETPPQVFREQHLCVFFFFLMLCVTHIFNPSKRNSSQKSIQNYTSDTRTNTRTWKIFLLCFVPHIIFEFFSIKEIGTLFFNTKMMFLHPQIRRRFWCILLFPLMWYVIYFLHQKNWERVFRIPRCYSMWDAQILFGVVFLLSLRYVWRIFVICFKKEFWRGSHISYVCVFMYISLPLSRFSTAYMYVYMYIYISLSVSRFSNMYVYMYIHVYIWISRFVEISVHVWIYLSHSLSPDSHVCICIYTKIYIYIYTYIHIYPYIYIYTRIHIYPSLSPNSHVCMYISISLSIQIWWG